MLININENPENPVVFLFLLWRNLILLPPLQPGQQMRHHWSSSDKPAKFNLRNPQGAFGDGDHGNDVFDHVGKAVKSLYLRYKHLLHRVIIGVVENCEDEDGAGVLILIDDHRWKKDLLVEEELEAPTLLSDPRCFTARWSYDGWWRQSDGSRLRRKQRGYPSSLDLSGV